MRMNKSEVFFMKIDLRLVSPLEKIFPDEPPRGGYLHASALKNEVASLQAAWIAPEGPMRDYVDLRVVSDAPVHLRRVRCVPVTFPTFPDADADYLRKAPGLYPDALEELPSLRLAAYCFHWEAVWIDIENAAPGAHAVSVQLFRPQDGVLLAEKTFTLTVIDAELPPQELIHTKWFHCDCLCQYYGVEMWSEEFWRICENYVRAMVRRGINMLLTPVHTPPLDTAVGGERMTCQLVDISLGNGGYEFGFDRLDRWVEMAKRCGVEYYEIAHLFTQWGAKHAPKIVAQVNGQEQLLFGWDTSATGDCYVDFLRAYLPALKAELARLGVLDRCYFHISDEPSLSMLEDYKAARDYACHDLQGLPVIDALSSFEFYSTGAVEHPVPAINHIQPFVDAGVPGLWTYYCIGQYKDVSNMFMAMPSQRNRILGVMLYKYNLAGFLQWGYNFWNAQQSTHPIDPWVSTDCDGFTPAGDAFQVYPAKDGTPVESLRMMVTAQALYDLRAFRLLESLRGRDFVMNLIEGEVGEITFTDYPRDAAYLPALREKVNSEIAQALARS